MADDTSASILTLVQPKRPKTAAERGRAFRQRQREKADKIAREKAVPFPVLLAKTAFANAANVTQTARTRSPAAVALTVAAFGLGAVGVTMNGWFARSLGSTDIAGWLFLGVGVAADCVALVIPSCAAVAWQSRQWATALAGWAVWLVTFAFAITAGIGFASTNIADVTLARSARSTPVIANAQTALADAMTSRDRECRGGVGKFCREREAAVTDSRQALDAAMRSVEVTADPQAEAAVKAAAWITRGIAQPTSDDFAMLRLILLALLPQIGGILLMVGRSSGREHGK